MSERQSCDGYVGRIMPQVECSMLKPQADDAGSYVLGVDLGSCPHRQLASSNAQHMAFVQHVSIVLGHVAQQEKMSCIPSCTFINYIVLSVLLQL